MEVFTIISALLFSTLIFDFLTEYRYTKKLLISWSIILFFIGAFRFQVGSDYINYSFTGESITKFKSFSDVFMFLSIRGTEIGYLLLGYFAKFFIDNFQCIFIAMSSIQSILLFKCITQYVESKYYLICLYAFYFTFYALSLTVCRQFIAIMICMYSLKYILKKDILRFFLCVFIAFLFHKSAIIFLFAYFIDKVTINMKTILVYVIILIFLSFGFKNVLEIITNFVGLYDSYSYESRAGSVNGLIVSSVFFIPMIYTYLVYYKKIEKKYRIIFKLYFIGFVLDIFSIQFFYFNRIALYYKIFFIFALIIPFKYLNINVNKAIISVCFLSLSFIVTHSTFSGVFLSEDKKYRTNPIINDFKIEWRDRFYEIE